MKPCECGNPYFWNDTGGWICTKCGKLYYPMELYDGNHKETNGEAQHDEGKCFNKRVIS